MVGAVTCGHAMGLGRCRDGDGDKHGVGKGIEMMGWHRGRSDVGLGMVRRLGWHGDGAVTERTSSHLEMGLDMAQAGHGNGE